MNKPTSLREEGTQNKRDSLYLQVIVFLVLTTIRYQCQCVYWFILLAISYLQIRQYGRLEDGSLNVVTRGQQRFHLKRCWNDVEGVVRKLLCLLPFIIIYLYISYVARG